MANRKGRELRRHVTEAMRDEGAGEFVASVSGTNHQRLDFVVDGYKGHFTFASTPKGQRETQNACAAARRAVRNARLRGQELIKGLDEARPRWVATPGSRLSALRQEAHRALDVHWEFGGCTRSEAYAWLAQRLGVPEASCHIGMFGEKECERVIALCRVESP